MPHSPTALTCVLLLSAPSAGAQLNDKWASFAEAPAALPSGASISGDDHETDLDWADLDLDGDVDLVVVRKEPFTTTGTRTNVLLVNEAGVLLDRSASLAAAADVAGDQGFLTPTNDRDVVVADLTGDGFPEVVTAPEQTVGQPKHVHHPRVYLNLGAGGGAWQGLRFEDARFPQLLHHASGIPLEPRFPAVDAGDLDNDGALDLYFGDHDTTTQLFGPTEQATLDLNDRLLQNDGSGFFTDATTTALTPAMVKSGFCNSVELTDVNLDGALDVVKQTTYQSPLVVSIAYNDPAMPGVFGQLATGVLPSPYFVDTGDLNNDGRPDIALTQNDADSVLFNLGSGPGGLVSWSAPQPVQFLVGGEAVGGFGLSYSSNNLIADLDGDGWSELLIADVDVEIPLYEDGFRLHLYHNRGGTPGGSDVALLEERASPSDDTWVGAHGLLPADLRWTHDVAAFDVDGDARPDLVLSRREGTQVWLQATPPVCQADLGFGGGALVLEVCGGDLSGGQDAELALLAGAPLAPAFLVIGAGAGPAFVPGLDVTVVPAPVTLVLTLATDAAGSLELPVPGGLGPAGAVVQAFQLTPGGLPLEASNAVAVQLLP